MTSGVSFYACHPQALRQVVRDHLHSAQVIIVSNREPYIHNYDADQHPVVQVPASGIVLFQGRQCRLNATLVGDQVRVDLTPLDARTGLMPLGN